MKVFIVECEHYTVPGRVVKVCATKELAELEATALAALENEPKG
jgi:hypothetical protein